MAALLLALLLIACCSPGTASSLRNARREAARNGRQCWPGEEAGIIPFLPIAPGETRCRNAARADQRGMNPESRDGRSLRLRIKFEPGRDFYAFITVRPRSFHCVSFTLPPP